MLHLVCTRLMFSWRITSRDLHMMMQRTHARTYEICRVNGTRIVCIVQGIARTTLLSCALFESQRQFSQIFIECCRLLQARSCTHKHWSAHMAIKRSWTQKSLISMHAITEFFASSSAGTRSRCLLSSEPCWTR